MTINQKENSAAVEGIGSMRMPSNTGAGRQQGDEARLDLDGPLDWRHGV